MDKKENKIKEKLRYELKFLVENLNEKKAEVIVKQNKAIFSEIYHKRRVNNIYLDTEGLFCYYSNINGDYNRFKIRIRWYGETFGKVDKPVLEFKMKNNMLGKKRQFLLKPFVLDKNFTIKTINKVLFDSNLPEDVLEKIKGYKPFLLNMYDRKYYLSANKKFRITIDFNLGFYKIGSFNNNFLHNFLHNNMTIVELKYDEHHDEQVDFITRQFPFRQSKSSKYLMGISLLKGLED